MRLFAQNELFKAPREYASVLNSPKYVAFRSSWGFSFTAYEFRRAKMSKTSLSGASRSKSTESSYFKIAV